MEAEPRALEGWRPRRPAWETTESGDLRRIGVEIEMIGPGVTEVAGVVAAQLGGTLRPVSRDEVAIVTREGLTWRVELDQAFLKQRSREQEEAEDGEASSWAVAQWVEELVRAGAEAIVPVELVSPPIPFPELTVVQELIAALREQGARGTRSGLAYAFGMQLNLEMPRCDATTVLAYTRAFACLYEWLVRESRIDLTRRLTRYAAPFPTEYVRRIIQPTYAPDLAALIDDYLEANPTRNRALDLLPLFTELDEARVRAAVTDPRVKARPALHYRLPNSEIDDPHWGVHLAWDDWLEVERLAADPRRLEEVCKAHAAFLSGGLERWVGDWASEVEPWLSGGDR